MLRDNPEEAQALLSDLLISVTTFFRDSDSFDELHRSVIPRLFKEVQHDASLRVWVAGCATGEEAYSLAMLLLEEASKHEPRPAIQVFGSDLDTRALTVAREGRYPATIESDVTEDRLRRFFTREGETYRVRQELRDIVLFAAHDLVKDPPFSHVDLISCRNVMIYLDRELQEQVCATFHYALKPGGYLMLGASESADNPTGLFRLLDRNARLYPIDHGAGRQAAPGAGPARASALARAWRAAGSRPESYRGVERSDAASARARKSGPAQHPGRRDASRAAHVGNSRPLHAALGRAC